MHLPGVTFGTETVVNANLWTLPAEFYCYLILAGLIVTGIAFNRAILTASFAIATVALLIANWFFDFNAEPWLLAGNINIYYFFVGAMFFHWRQLIPYTFWLLVPAIILSYGLLFTAHAVYIIPPILTYITVFVGLTNFPPSKLLQSGDYSYGIYLYGFPINEALLATFPALRGNFFSLVASTIICTGLFAFLSWHLVEKRFRDYGSTFRRSRQGLQPICIRKSLPRNQQHWPNPPHELRAGRRERRRQFFSCYRGRRNHGKRPFCQLKARLSTSLRRDDKAS